MEKKATEIPEMNRAEVMKLQKALQDLSINMIKDLKKMTPANAHAEMMTMQYKLIDKFFI